MDRVITTPCSLPVCVCVCVWDALCACGTWIESWVFVCMCVCLPPPSILGLWQRYEEHARPPVPYNRGSVGLLYNELETAIARNKCVCHDPLCVCVPCIVVSVLLG